MLLVLFIYHISFSQNVAPRDTAGTQVPEKAGIEEVSGGEPGDSSSPALSPSTQSSERANANNEKGQKTAYESEAPLGIRDCPVTNVFYDADLREILQAMAAQCYVNIVADETASGIITVEFEDVPLEDALRRILNPFGLTFRWLDGYYLVGSPHPSNPSFPKLTKTELYRPNFIKAADVIKLLSTFYEPYVRVNQESNTVSLVGSPDLISRIKLDLAEIDQPPRQVMIEALVTEMSSDVNRQLGISWNLIGAKEDGDAAMIDAFGRAATDTVRLSPDGLTARFLQVPAVAGDWVGKFRAQLDALVQEGKVTIRANPRVATLEGNQARIFIGREAYFSLQTGNTQYAYIQLEVIKTGISLTITPYVSDDGFITLDVEPVVSDVIGSSGGEQELPVTNARSVSTRVRVRAGGTVAIGGLKVRNDVEIRRKIPILGSIPLLGYLFSHTDKDVIEREVTVLITPYLWEQVGEPVSEPEG